MASKKYAVPDKSSCVACGACKPKCPRNAIRIQRGCFAMIDTELCVGCGKCEKICPIGCISLEDREEVSREPEE